MDAGRRHSGATVRFHAAIGERLGLGRADHKYFDVLWERGPMPAGELARLTGRSTGAITTVIDRLENVGLVRRVADPTDRRRVIVEPALSPERERELAKLWASAIERWTELLSRYTEREVRVIIDFLRKDRDILNEEAQALHGEGGQSNAKGASKRSSRRRRR